MMLSPLSWLVSVALVQHIVARARGANWGWLAVLGFLAVPHITELAHNAYGEIYFVALYLSTLALLARFEERGHVAWLFVAALPLLVASAIRTGKVESIDNYIQTGRDEGMFTFDESVKQLLRAGKITRAVAEQNVRDVSYLRG